MSYLKIYNNIKLKRSYLIYVGDCMEKIAFYDDGKYEIYREVDGIKEGKAIYYYSKEILQSVPYRLKKDYEKLREEFNYDNGIKNGRAVTYFNKDKTNKVWEKFIFFNGIKEGEAWLLSADKLEKRYYVNGKVEGLTVQYYLNGNIEEGLYINGRRNLSFIFKNLEEILGMYDTSLKETIINNEIMEDRKSGYKVFKIQAEKILSEELYNNFQTRENKKDRLAELFIKKYYLNK